MRPSAVIAIATLTFSTIARAQFPPLRPSPEKAGAELAYVDVAVTDSSGRISPALTAPDFTLSQDGKPLSIAKFSYVDTSRERSLVLVVDDLGLSSDGLGRVRHSLRRFLDEQMQPGDRAAIVRTSGGSSAMRQLTSEKRALEDALGHVDYNRLQDAAGARPGAFHAGTLQGLRAILYDLRPATGRKAVVLFSERMNLAPPVAASANESTESLATTCTELAGLAMAVFYAIDLRPVRTSALPMEIVSRSMVQIETGIPGIAAETGGLTLDAPDVSAALARVLQDQTGYYRLGFKSEDRYRDYATGTAVYRKIAVKAVPPGAAARSRGTVYVGAGEGLPAEAASDTAQPQPARTPIPVSLTPLFFNAENTGSYINFLIHVDGASVTSLRDLNGRYTSALDLSVTVYSSSGQAGSPVNRGLKFSSTDAGHSIAHQYGLMYSTQVATPVPGLYRIQATVRDETGGRAGSTSEFFAVPDLKSGELQLSSIVLGPVQGDTAPADQVLREGPAVRSYATGSTVHYGYDLYNLTRGPDGNSEAEVRTNLYRSGEPVYTGSARAVSFAGMGDDKRRSIGGTLTLTKALAPGRYVMEVVATDKLSAKPREATQYIDLQLRP